MSTISVSNSFACTVKEYTSEHPLKLIRVLETASLFQLRNHTRFCLVGCRYPVNETLAKLSRVESLKDVLLLDVLEYDHL